MAELNFPANPQIDDEYTFNNLLYKYDGEKWTTWGSGANTALDLRNELASTQGASMVVTASGNTVQEELDMAGSGLSLEPLRRSYAEAGFDMDISESFALGGTLDAPDQVLLGEGLIGYSWGGAFPKEVPPNSTPLSTGGIGSAAWIDQSNNLLRAQAKSYIDNGFVAKSGDTMTGELVVSTHSSGSAVALKSGASNGTVNFHGAGGVRTWQLSGRSDPADSVNDYFSLEQYDTADDNTHIHTAFSYRVGEDTTILRNPKSATAQGDGGEYLTRKDYVDGVVNGKLSLSGGTLTGPLVVKGSGLAGAKLHTQPTASSLEFLRADGSLARNIFFNGDNGDVTINAYDGTGNFSSTFLTLEQSTGYTKMSYPVAGTTQANLPEALTRKDYVDTTLLEVRESLEAKITTLMARIEALEAINNTPTA